MRSAVLLRRPSGRGPGHRGRGRACRGPECGRHLSSDAGLCRLWADEIRQAAGLLGDAAPGDPAHDDPRSLCAMAMAGHGHWASFRPVAGGTHPRPAGIAEHIQRVRIWACSRRWRSCARSDTLVLDASVCCVSSSGSSPAGGATALRREALDHEAFDSGRRRGRSTVGVVVVFRQ